MCSSRGIGQGGEAGCVWDVYRPYIPYEDSSNPERRKGHKAVASYGGERVAVTRLAGMLKTARSAKPRQMVQVVDENGQHMELPAPLADVMARAASLMAEGRHVSVIADDEMLTTQQAAVLLNVSRQYVTRLVDRGALPATKVGSHRRLRVRDVEAYRLARDIDRDRALDELASLSQGMEGYGLGR
jgi:excisionase family DNA binding protein